MRSVISVAAVVVGISSAASTAVADEYWLDVRGKCLVVAGGDLYTNREAYAQCWKNYDYKLKSVDETGKACSAGSDVQSCYTYTKQRARLLKN